MALSWRSFFPVLLMAQENVEHNHVEQIVSVQQGNLLDRVSDTCDICSVSLASRNSALA